MHRTGLSDHFSYTANCPTYVWKSQWGKIKAKLQCLKRPYEQRWAKNLIIIIIIIIYTTTTANNNNNNNNYYYFNNIIIIIIIIIK